jgi:ABC-type transporter Mla maintaining outer membrane lipid asymmetry ATPase subunit MlaF
MGKNTKKVELPKLIVVLGPTATGKSDLAVDIALRLKKTQGKTWVFCLHLCLKIYRL